MGKSRVQTRVPFRGPLPGALVSAPNLIPRAFPPQERHGNAFVSGVSIACVADETKPRYIYIGLYRGLNSSATQARVSRGECGIIFPLSALSKGIVAPKSW